MSNRKRSASRLKREGFDKPRSLSSLRRCKGSQEEEEMKEHIADEMLRNAGQCTARPALSDPQLNRSLRGRVVVRLDTVSDSMISQRPNQPAIDELKFLMRADSVIDAGTILPAGMDAWVVSGRDNHTLDGSLRSGWSELHGVQGVERRNDQVQRQRQPELQRRVQYYAVYHHPARRRDSWRTADLRELQGAVCTGAWRRYLLQYWVPVCICCDAYAQRLAR